MIEPQPTVASGINGQRSKRDAMVFDKRGHGSKHHETGHHRPG
jgi:hypothetical protein